MRIQVELLPFKLKGVCVGRGGRVGGVASWCWVRLVSGSVRLDLLVYLPRAYFIFTTLRK